jgi:hypothetical protein
VGKPVIKHNPKVAQIFEDLEKYLDFCRDFGYKFNEADLYNWQRYSWQQYSKYSQGKNAKDQWTADLGRQGR